MGFLKDLRFISSLNVINKGAHYSITVRKLLKRQIYAILVFLCVVNELDSVFCWKSDKRYWQSNLIPLLGFEAWSTVIMTIKCSNE